MSRARAKAFVAAAGLGLAVAAAAPSVASAASLSSIKHIVVVYEENWSFDSLYGKFPGADGLAQAVHAAPQVNAQGVPFPNLPQPLANAPGAQPTNPAVAENAQIAKPPAPRPPDPQFPAAMPNAPFDLGKYVPPDKETGDLLGNFYAEQKQIDGGRMDRFVSAGNSGALPMGYYDASKLPMGQLAARFTLDDHFFHAAYGGSFLNHEYLVGAEPLRWPDAPDAVRAQVAPDGTLLRNGAVSSDGFVVNTAYPKDGPHPAATNPAELVPPQHGRTIGDELSAKGISWAWYAGGWKDAAAGHPGPLFQFNHQPFAYFAKYAIGTKAERRHLLDETDLDAAIRRGKLPAVAFYKPEGQDNEHPGYTNVLRGDAHAAALVSRIMNGPQWKSTAIIFTYDENGGFWDHVAPPKGDRFGPGTRIPTIVISPFAKRHYVDHTTYDTTSITRLIERRWRLGALHSRDAKAHDLENSFDFSRRSR